jgi:tRNA-specific 2-thiouridylase
MNDKKTVVIGMSGGVDSSVAASLLLEEGYDVLGLFMKNWDETDCPQEKDYQDAIHVAEKIGIPLYTVNFTKEYWEHVFSSLINGLKKGITPNPDILCNREIKFHHFLNKALSLGANYLATGHYAQVDSEGRLYRGRDSNKDQSYFLHAVHQKALKKTLFPIGNLLKPDLREIAKKRGLITHNKKDSTGICFIGKRKFPDFIKDFITPKKGPFLTPEGKIIGYHDGAWNYTIGQRKGLGIGGPGDAWFVVHKKIEENVVIITQGENNPLLFSPSLIAIDPTWIAEEPILPFYCTAKIRYRSEDTPCLIESIQNGQLLVQFKQPQRAITPGQSIVFYKDDLCLGGAIISST